MITTREAGARNLMAATWTKAAKVRRAFKAGRPRRADLVLTTTRAILEGSIVLHELKRAMAATGLAEDDANAALVLVSDAGDRDLIYIARLPEMEGLPKLASDLGSLEGVWRPTGVIFHQLDREAMKPEDPRSGAVSWVQQWLIDPRASRALLKARNVVAEGGDGRHSFN